MMRPRLRLTSLLVLFALGCGRPGEVIRKGEILDTPFEIIVNWEGSSKKAAAELSGKASDLLESRFKSAHQDGNFTFAANEEPSSLNQDAAALLQQAEAFRLLTDSTYDYRQGAVRELWGLNKRRPQPPEPAALEKALMNAHLLSLKVEGDRASLNHSYATSTGIGWKIDLGRFAEGWAVDGAAELLIEDGIKRGKVSLGSVTRVWGEMRAEGLPWQLDVPPLPGDSIYTVIRPTDGALCVIHPAVDGFELDDKLRPRLLDPRSGLPSDSALAVVSWAPDGASAGAFAEALFVMGRRRAFAWVARHRPAGLFYIYNNPVDSGQLAEADPQLVPWVTDSLQSER